MEADTQVVFHMEPLQPDEKERLAHLEGVIRESIRAFENFGMALAEIRKRGLYRETHVTFEAYVREVWETPVRTAYQKMAAALVMTNVRNCAQKIGMVPKNEAQARVLAQLKEEDQVAAWAQVVETAPDGNITARHVRDVVKSIKGETVNQQVKRTRKKVESVADVSPEMKAAFKAFLTEIQRAHDEGWKRDNKGSVLQELQTLISVIEAD